MAETQEVQIKITADTSGASSSVGSIKKQLKEATQELITMREQFGETSVEAINAAKKVANLKDEIGDAKALTEAFNPDAKFKAFGAALQGVAGGFAAVQGAMGLMGSESEDVEKMLLKVNSAMALSQGIDSVLESADSFKILGAKMKTIPIVQKAITAAQWLWNAAMAANPIGAIVVAIAALIAGVIALTSYFMSNAKASRENAKAVKENAEALEAQKKATAKAADELDRAQAYTVAMAKANGATTASIRALELKLIDEKIATEKATRQTALNTIEKNRNELATLRQRDASDELIKKQQETLNESIKFANEQTANLNKSYVDREQLNRRHNVEIATENKKATDDAKANEKKSADDRIAKQKAANDKAKEERERIAAQRLVETQKTEELIVQARIASIKDQTGRAQFELEIQRDKEIEEALKAKDAKLISDEQYQIRRTAIDTKYTIDRNKILSDAQKVKDDAQAVIDKEAADKKIAFEDETAKLISDNKINAIKSETDKAREIERLRYESAQTAALKALDNKEITQIQYDARMLALKKEHEAKITGIQETEGEKQKEIDKKTAEARIASAKAIGEALGTLSDLIGKQTVAGKALGIASATINTFVGATEVLRAKSVLPEPIATISKIANVAAIIASGIKSIKSIVATKVPAGGGGGGGSVPSASQVSAPIAPTLGSTLINQGQVNQIGSAASRAYVVESDVTGNQERISRINRAALIS